METDIDKAGRILDEARQAFQDQDYALALERYEWFFDHALDDPKSGHSGVRLSYCLEEWAKIGQVFAPARVKLEQRRSQTIQELEAGRDPRKFHELMALCNYTNAPAVAVDKFLEYHRSDRQFAGRIYGYIRNELAAAGQWEVCGAHTEDADDAYAHMLEVFDRSSEVFSRNPALGDPELENLCKGWYLKDVTNLVLVLTHTQRTEEAQRICERANKDMQQRGLQEFLSVYPEDFEE